MQSSTSANFRHRTITKEQCNAVADGIQKVNPKDSVEHNLAQGYELEWCSEKNAKGEVQIVPKWMTKTGKPAYDTQTNTFVFPPMPATKFYLTMPDMFKFEQDLDKITQVVQFPSIETIDDKFARFKKAWIYMLTFLNEDRCDELSKNPSDMLTDEQCRLSKTNPEKLKEQLLDALNSEHNISQRRASQPKKKVFGVNYNNKFNPADLDKIRQFEGDESIKQKMLDAISDPTDGKSRRFTPMNIFLPDGTPLDPKDYGLLHSNGAIVYPTISVYRLHCRRRKSVPEQISVVWAHTALGIVTNGIPSSGSITPMDVTKILDSPSKAKQSEDSPAKMVVPASMLDFSDTSSDSEDSETTKVEELKRKAGISVDAKGKRTLGSNGRKRSKTTK